MEELSTSSSKNIERGKHIYQIYFEEFEKVVEIDFAEFRTELSNLEVPISFTEQQFKDYKIITQRRCLNEFMAAQCVMKDQLDESKILETFMQLIGEELNHVFPGKLHFVIGQTNKLALSMLSALKKIICENGQEQD